MVYYWLFNKTRFYRVQVDPVTFIIKKAPYDVQKFKGAPLRSLVEWLNYDGLASFKEESNPYAN